MKLKVTLTRSLIGRKPNQVKTAKSLRLHKINDFTIIEKNAANIGKLNVIKHLVELEDVK